jgi:hypothetical protein
MVLVDRPQGLWIVEIGMMQLKNENDGLDELRRSLAQFVLREAGQAVAADPSLPLSSALVEAVREEARRAVEHYHQSMPTSEELADRIQDAVAPRLVQIAQAAAEGKIQSLDRNGQRSGLMTSKLFMIAIGLAVALALFAAGYASAILTQRFRPSLPLYEQKADSLSSINDGDAGDPSSRVDSSSQPPTEYTKNTPKESPPQDDPPETKPKKNETRASKPAPVQKPASKANPKKDEPPAMPADSDRGTGT